MAVIRKFMFDQEFGEPGDAPQRPKRAAAAPAPAPEPPTEPPAPTFSEDEINAARDQAYEAGRAAGLREAEASRARLLANAEQALSTQLQELMRRHAEEAEARHRDAVRVAMAVVARIVPGLAARNGLSEVEALFAECMDTLTDEPRVTVRVHDAIAEEASARLGEIAAQAGFEGRLQVIGDPAVGPGDCRIEWAEGGAERNMARLWQEIEAILDRALGPGSLDVASEV